MSKKIFMSTVLYFLIIVGNVKADIPVTLKIHNVIENCGIVYAGYIAMKYPIKIKRWNV
jgi:archaellum biogenesis protein FlaJ (TadC family)